ncbi:MAG: PDZ domain-containing protein [Pyrinomonadaceae bacterium]
MVTEQTQTGTATSNEFGAEYATDAGGCPRCHNAVTPGMQFCRSCGFRLFDGGPPMPSYASAQMTQSPSYGSKARRSGPHWLIWVIIALIVSSAIGGGFLFRPKRPTSYVGVDNMRTADGGAMIGDVSPPGSSADKAGLIGGDVITALNGQPIRSSREFTNFLSKLPVGTEVEVAYVRDGIAKTTKLTTISRDDLSNLNNAFAALPQGKFGVGDNERVQVPGQSIYGVKIDDVEKNAPAYIAGLRDDDIVIQMDDIPIRTGDEFESRIHRAKPDSVVKVIVMRGPAQMEIPVKVGER